MKEEIRIDTEKDCKICCSSLADTILKPCGHGDICMKCSKRIQVCPQCRTEIQVRCLSS